MPTPPKNVFEWSKAFFRNADRDLHETRATMAALMTYADFNNLTCYPSQQRLAQNTGASVDTVRRHLRTNVEAGWLKIVKQGGPGKNTRYQLTVPSTDAGNIPARVRGCPSTGAGIHPGTGAALTTQRTIHGTNHGSDQGPRAPSCDGSRGDDLSAIDETNQVPLPGTGAGIGPRTDAGPVAPASEARPKPTDPGGSPPFASAQAKTKTPWPRNKPLPLDPFASFVDADTGEPFNYTPGELPTVMSK